MKYQRGDVVTIKPWVDLEKLGRIEDYYSYPSIVFSTGSIWYYHYETSLPRSREATLGGELMSGGFSWGIKSIPQEAIEMCIDFREPDEQNRVEMWGYLKLAELALKEGITE